MPTGAIFGGKTCGFGLGGGFVLKGGGAGEKEIATLGSWRRSLCFFSQVDCSNTRMAGHHCKVANAGSYIKSNKTVRQLSRSDTNASSLLRVDSNPSNMPVLCVGSFSPLRSIGEYWATCRQSCCLSCSFASSQCKTPSSQTPARTKPAIAVSPRWQSNTTKALASKRRSSSQKPKLAGDEEALYAAPSYEGLNGNRVVR